MLIDHLKQAERHVQQGERIVADERTVIEERRKNGHDVKQSERLLSKLVEIQGLHIAHRDYILRELEELKDSG